MFPDRPNTFEDDAWLKQRYMDCAQAAIAAMQPIMESILSKRMMRFNEDGILSLVECEKCAAIAAMQPDKRLEVAEKALEEIANDELHEVSSCAIAREALAAIRGDKPQQDT